jgi:hypothetical protein
MNYFSQDIMMTYGHSYHALKIEHGISAVIFSQPEPTLKLGPKEALGKVDAVAVAAPKKTPVHGLQFANQPAPPVIGNS